MEQFKENGEVVGYVGTAFDLWAASNLTEGGYKKHRRNLQAETEGAEELPFPLMEEDIVRDGVTWPEWCEQFGLNEEHDRDVRFMVRSDGTVLPAEVEDAAFMGVLSEEEPEVPPNAFDRVTERLAVP